MMKNLFGDCHFLSEQKNHFCRFRLEKVIPWRDNRMPHQYLPGTLYENKCCCLGDKEPLRTLTLTLAGVHNAECVSLSPEHKDGESEALKM
jgi:hypothetical protein